MGLSKTMSEQVRCTSSESSEGDRLEDEADNLKYYRSTLRKVGKSRKGLLCGLNLEILGYLHFYGQFKPFP